MSFEEHVEDKLWPILVETVHSLVMYPHHKAYSRDAILSEKPETTAIELASRLGISVGEAMVILYELSQERNAKT